MNATSLVGKVRRIQDKVKSGTYAVTRERRGHRKCWLPAIWMWNKWLREQASPLQASPQHPITVWLYQRLAGMRSKGRNKNFTMENQISAATYVLFQLHFYTLGFCHSLVLWPYLYPKSFGQVQGLLLFLMKLLSVLSNC